MTTEASIPEPLAGPEGLNAGGSGQPQHQQQNAGAMASTPSGYMNGSFFESPMMSNSAILDYQQRQMSPPSSTHFLSLSLGDTPSISKGSFDNGNGASMQDQQMKKRSAAVVNKLMNVELQNQKKRNDESTPPTSIATPGLFAPLETSGAPLELRSHPSLGDMQSSAQMQSGPMTNLLRSARLSSNAGADDAFLDSAFPGDFPYTFSPGEIVRSLGGSQSIPESPMSQNLRMFPYSSGYNMIPTGPSWNSVSTSQYPPLPSLATPAYQSRGLESQQLARPGGQHDRGKSAKRRKDSDSEDTEPVKKKKKPAKPVDPNEPKITSKHRGVCWYKRTKKWVVQTKVNGKRVHVGYFDDEEKAAEAYKNAVQGIQVKKALEAKQRSLDEANRAHGNGGSHMLSLPQ